MRASQRERLLRSVIAAVSESGYLAVTVAAIVRRARVSRVAFYAHFADKDCFLTATAEGRELMIARKIFPCLADSGTRAPAPSCR
jgi:AcrR family transcriptional regulator